MEIIHREIKMLKIILVFSVFQFHILSLGCISTFQRDFSMETVEVSSYKPRTELYFSRLRGHQTFPNFQVYETHTSKDINCVILCLQSPECEIYKTSIGRNNEICELVKDTGAVSDGFTFTENDSNTAWKAMNTTVILQTIRYASVRYLEADTDTMNTVN